MSTATKRKAKADSQVEAYNFGVRSAREIIGPMIWKRAAIRSGGLGFFLGLCAGIGIGHYFG